MGTESLETTLHQGPHQQSPCPIPGTGQPLPALPVLGNAHPRMPWQNYFPTLKPANQRQAVVRSKAWHHSSIWAVLPLPTSHGGQSYPCFCSAALAFPCLPEAWGAQQSQLFLLSLISSQGKICLAGILALANQTNNLCNKALTTKPRFWG